MSLWWRILLLSGLAALLSGCYLTHPEPQDNLLANPDYEIVSSASFCENQWPYIPKSGSLHVHSLLSSTVRRYRNILDDGDHHYSDDLPALMERFSDDFTGICDHGEKLTPGEWLRLCDLGSLYAAGNRVVLPGFEWTVGGYKDDVCTHLAVYGSTEIAGAWIENQGTEDENWDGALCPELADLYAWLDQRDEPWVGCFAHPWSGAFQFGNFHLPKNKDTLRTGMALIEVGGGLSPAHIMSFAIGEECFQRAIAHRWWVGPVYGLDNQTKPFDGNTDQTVVWCRKDDQFDRDDLIDGFRGRRTFVRRGEIDEVRFAGKAVDATEYTSLGQAMECMSGARVEWQFLIRHELVGITVDLVSVYNDGNTQSFSLNPNQLAGHGRPGTEAMTVRLLPADEVICTYLRVRQGTAIMALSAPIWINRAKAEAPQDMFETLGFSQLNADPYCAEVATFNLSNLKPTYNVRYEPGQEFGAIVEVDSRYPVVFLVTGRDDRTRTLFCQGFASRGQRALWLHKNTTAETEYLSVFVLYKDQPDSWAGHVELRPNYFSSQQQVYEFDDDLTHRDVTLYYQERP